MYQTQTAGTAEYVRIAFLGMDVQGGVLAGRVYYCEIQHTADLNYRPSCQISSRLMKVNSQTWGNWDGQLCRMGQCLEDIEWVILRLETSYADLNIRGIATKNTNA